MVAFEKIQEIAELERERNKHFMEGMRRTLRHQQIILKQRFGADPLASEEGEFLEEMRLENEQFKERMAQREMEERAAALTVGRLRELLSKYPDEMPVRVVEGYRDWDEPYAGEHHVRDDGAGTLRIGG